MTLNSLFVPVPKKAISLFAMKSIRKISMLVKTLESIVKIHRWYIPSHRILQETVHNGQE